MSRVSVYSQVCMPIVRKMYLKLALYIFCGSLVLLSFRIFSSYNIWVFISLVLASSGVVILSLVSDTYLRERGVRSRLSDSYILICLTLGWIILVLYLFNSLTYPVILNTALRYGLISLGYSSVATLLHSVAVATYLSIGTTKK